MVKKEERVKVINKARVIAEERLLDVLLPSRKKGLGRKVLNSWRKKSVSLSGSRCVESFVANADINCQPKRNVAQSVEPTDG
jgi:ATP-dependent protease HslVU (ClpYQ) ATPase subunit